jgi:phosphohistidine phosphatase SixA
MKKLILALLCCLFAVYAVKGQTTRIFLLRHAEKSTANATDTDPSLSKEGQERALSLASRLAREKVDVIYSTDFKRTLETVKPLAQAQRITVHKYNPGYPKALSALINSNYAGKTILIVGHSDTVLELVEAFGAERPVKKLTDNDYDNLFLITIKDNVAKVSIEKYGKPHHSRIL